MSAPVHTLTDTTAVNDNVNTLTFAKTVSPGDQILIVELGFREDSFGTIPADTIVTVTTDNPINPTNLLSLNQVLNTSLYSGVFYLVNPSMGLHNITITISNIPPNPNYTVVAVAQTYSSINTTVPFGGFITGSGGDFTALVPGNTSDPAQQSVVDALTLLFAVVTASVPAFDPIQTTTIDDRTREFVTVRTPATQNSLYNYSLLPSSSYIYTSFILNGPLICLDGSTRILMADESEKMIKYIKRGDMVFGNFEKTIVNKVSEVLVTIISGDYPVNVVEIKKGALGDNLPKYDLIGTDPHPIIWNGKRRPMKCFVKFSGVMYLPGTMAKNILTPIDNDKYAVYDLVFDTECDYIANGLLVQAHSPWCKIRPLPKDLYYDINNYREKRSYKCQNHSLPWSNAVVIPE